MSFPTVTSLFKLRPADIPPVLRTLIENILPSENVGNWLEDVEAFPSGSALELLSVRHDYDAARLATNVREVVESAYYVLEFISVPGLPSVNEVHAAVVDAQKKALAAQLGCGALQRFVKPEVPKRGPAKIFGESHEPSVPGDDPAKIRKKDAA